MKQGILTINAGSSSIKFALFELNSGLARHPSLSGQIDGLGAEARLVATHGSGQAFPEVVLKPGVQHQEAFDELLRWLGGHNEDDWKITAVGHRVVHGGLIWTPPVWRASS